MDSTTNPFQPREGMDVFGSDDEKIGEVDTVESNYFVVRKGFFFPEDHYIPVDAVSTFDEDRIYLNYTKDQVLEQQWGSPPVATTTERATTSDHDTTAAGTTSADYDTAATGTTGTAGTVDTEDVLDRDVADRDYTQHDSTEQHETNIPVHEEELVTRRRDVDRGSVNVSKHVVEEEAAVDVPVTEERVEVSRRAVDRDVQTGDDAFQEGTIEIPVHGEEVEVDKQARVVEEIDVDKTATQNTKHVTDTVRREEVTIDGEEVEGGTDPDRRY
jgi:uncharacterized protein (TIGR02271 family)